MTEWRELSEKYAEIGARLIRDEDCLAAVRESQVTICYLSSNKAKKSHGRPVYGECERVADKNKWAIPCDFTVTLFEPNCDGMSARQVEALILHELLHVGVEVTEDGEEKFFIVPHDLQDFKIIVNRYGTDWAEH